MDDWKVVPIGDVAEIFDGPHATPETVDAGPIFLGIGALENGRINLGETRHVTPEDFATWTRRVKPRARDVVFSYETRLGQVAMIPDDFECCLGRRMGLVRVNHNKLDPHFFLYSYLSPQFQEFLRSRTIPGATVDRLPLKDFPSFPISVPPMDVQRSIASFLSSIDDKIELNRRINGTLEAMAQAIFRDWFVDFGPVRRKLAGETDPAVIMGGLTPDPARAAELAALFPAALSDEGLPDGWLESTLGEEFDVKIGRTPPRKEKEHFLGQSIGVPWCSIRDMAGSDVFIGTTSETLRPESVAAFRVSRLPELTVIVSFKLTVGRVAISDREMTTNEAIAQMIRRATSPSTWFTFCYLRQFDYGSLGSTSSIATAVNSATIRAMPIKKADSAVREAFDVVVGPLFQRLREAAHESRTLAETRDYLLPRLMSGAVRVGDAAAEIGA